MSLRSRLRDFKLSLAESACDLSDRRSKKRAVWFMLIFDHGILRSVWRNFAEVAPGVFRANQPSPEMLIRYLRRGIKSVVNLRGASENPPYLLEQLQCKTLGLTLHDVGGLAARTAPARRDLIAVLETLRAAEKPVLMHCKSGADRTSLAAAIYVLAEAGGSLDEARKHFSPRYIHFKWTKAGVLDHILDTYETAHTDSGIGFEDWLRGSYDGDAIQASFDALRRA